MKLIVKLVSFCIAAGSLALCSEMPPKKDAPPTGPVSYYKQIRPVFQANCQGCHQPAKAKGGYVMTDFARMVAGGESKDKTPAIIPKDPAKSFLIQQITPEKGAAEMPKGKSALLESEIALISRWISEGAIDDTPANAIQRYDTEHAPTYTLLPVITSLDFSPDGKWLAVTGFHEVLLHKADGSGIAARLIGMSERIESVRFSPDGKYLAVAGGLPARMGEVQIWDIEKLKLKTSVPITYDTVYGVSWSPDGKLVSFGCSDNTVRAIEAESGKQVLQQGSHSDWVLDTAFSLKGDHIVSVGRDMSAKLTEVATQRFVDNITSITPGALRGGLHSVAFHPSEEQVLIGGADGAPQIYRIFRQTARKIGDNANLIRKFPEMTGRIFSVRFNKDGSEFAAASSLDNAGHLAVYANDKKAVIPEDIKKIMAKEFDRQSGEEKAALQKYHDGSAQLLKFKLDIPGSGVYAVAFSPDSETLAAGGQDGTVRFVHVADGKIAKEFPAATISKDAVAARAVETVPTMHATGQATYEADAMTLPPDWTLDVQPPEINLARPSDSIQLLVTARSATGETIDVTGQVHYILTSGIAQISPRGAMIPSKNGTGRLAIVLGKQKAEVPVTISGQSENYKFDFIRDVNPVLSRMGCNAGTCHGAREGKNGFKLSLRGYDPIVDVRAFGDDLASRRVNFASPDDSLMLLKPTAAVPHEGGQRFKPDDNYYRIVRDWIADGAKLNLETPRVAKIEVFPKNPVIQKIGSKQQMRVVATYANGDVRDVTAEAFIDSGNTDVATADVGGVIGTLRRGEAPVLARYEGNYAASTITVMGDRSGFEWKAPPTYGRVDELVADKWQRMKIQPSELCSDTEFIRRVYLDLTGLPPTADDVRAFVADKRSDPNSAEGRAKRDELVDKLIGNPDFIDHWANKWADLLQVNRKYLGTEGAPLFRDWIRKQVAANTPYDEFAREILTATGSNKDNPAASYFKVLREPAETMENTTHLFLATRFNCNKCHDHPFERWTQDQYYQTAAFFAQVELKADPASGEKKIGGSAVEGAKPLYEFVADKASGDVTHLRTSKVAPPTFPFPAKYSLKDEAKATRRQKLAAWMTSADNRYFAMSYVNRLWGYMLGVGIIEPLDDIRAGNPPGNPELLDYLTHEFIAHNFDTRYVIGLICKARVYQLSIVPNKWNADDKTNYSHALARRLPAEVLCDAVFKVTGSAPSFPGVKPGTRAAQLPDSGIDLPSGFLANLGRPPRESACECERSNDIRLGSVMSLLSGPTVSDAIDDPKNEIAKLVAATPDDDKLINEIFMRVLNRPAAQDEIAKARKSMSGISADDSKLTTELEAMEKAQAPIIAEQERKRQEEIERSKKELADYEKAIAPKLAEDERKRLDRVAAAEKKLKEYEGKLSPAREEWEKKITPDQLETEWVAVDVKTATATGDVKLEKRKDGTVYASNSSANTEYTITADTDLVDVTGIKLEVLPDDSLPNFGPGHAKDANFVLTEFKLETEAKGAKKMAKAKIADARADFTQKDFDVKQTYEEKPDAKKGWAIAGTPAGQIHQATYALAKPFGDAKGSSIKVVLVQKFRDSFTIGRFRLWLTTSKKPLEFGLPANVVSILKADKAARTKEQTAALQEYFESIDGQLLKDRHDVIVQKRPLPIDAKITELKAAVTKAEEPIKIEPKLVQLRLDAKMSAEQVHNKRLTGAQDLVWALVNTPSFLFNR